MVLLSSAESASALDCPFLDVVARAQPHIDSAKVEGLKSDIVLSHLRDGLVALGFDVESGRKADQKVRRPVLFGENGVERVAYEINAFHDEYGIVVEVEAGRGTMGNAIYRDFIRTSLIVDARFLALGVMREYRYGQKQVVARSYEIAKDQLDAIYASGRLQLPFEGILRSSSPFCG